MVLVSAGLAGPAQAAPPTPTPRKVPAAKRVDAGKYLLGDVPRGLDVGLLPATGDTRFHGRKGSLAHNGADPAGRTIVYVDGRDAATARDAVTRAGGVVTHQTGTRMRAAVPGSALIPLAQQPGVTQVRQPDRAIPLAVTSEGTSLSGAANWIRDGKAGAGVKIGIIDLGFEELAEAQGAGELPATGASLALDPTSCPTSNVSSHGTAVAEVTHDLAPDASLLLACAPDAMTFPAAADWLVSQGAQIITTAIGFPNTGRGDGTGPDGSPAEVVRRVRQTGVLWVTAAGNQAQLHWSGPATDTDSDGLVEVSGTAEGNGFALPAGGTATIALKWDGWPTTRKDLDLVVMGKAGLPTGPGDPNIVAQSTRAQADSATPLSPTEDVTIQNTTGGTQQYWIYLPTRAAYQDTRADVFVMGDVTSLSYPTPAGSVLEPATSPYAMAVGASLAGSGRVEDYSSRGPTIDGRIKPNLTGFDGVTTVTYGPGADFRGTSAAAASVAGAAALLKGANPALDAAQVQALLEERTQPSKLDNQWGRGLLALGAPGVPQPPAANGYTPLPTPTRLLDTTTTLGAHNKQLTAGESLTVAMDGVPNDTTAVAVNLTASSADQTKVDIYRDVDSYSGTTSINLAKGEKRTVFAIVPVSTARTIAIRNDAGKADAALDLLGYFSTGSAARYTPRDVPKRILDSRTGLVRSEPLGAGAEQVLPVRGVADVPSTATAVLATVTVTDATVDTRVDVYGQNRPSQYATVHGAPWRTRGNVVLAAIGEDGTIRIRNDQGTAHVMLDVLGWFAPGTGAGYVPLPQAAKVLDTRTGTGGRSTPAGPGEAVGVQVSNLAGVPQGATAAVLSVTGGGDKATSLSAGPAERGWSGLPSIDGIETDGTVSGPATPRLGPTGQILVRNDAGTSHLSAAVTGYFVGGQPLAADNSSCRHDAEPGFLPLYDGRSPQSRQWRIAGAGTGSESSCELWLSDTTSTQWYAGQHTTPSYTLRADWKASDQSADSGVYLGFPMPDTDPAAPSTRGIEIKIKPSGAGATATGAIAGLKAPTVTPAERPLGEWNNFEITVDGKHVVVRLNDVIVNDYTEPSANRLVKAGFIGIQGGQAGAEVRFRNIRVQLGNRPPLLGRFGDFNGDGKPDIAGYGGAGDLWIHANTSTPGNLSKKNSKFVSNGWGNVHPVMTADIDGDGKSDIFGLDSKTWTIWRNSTTSTSTSTDYSFAYNSLGAGWDVFTKWLPPADFDGDGRPDIAAIATNDLWIHRNVSTPGTIADGGGQFVSTAWGSVPSFITEDFDGDGRADIMAQFNNNLFLWRNTSNGTRYSFASQPEGLELGRNCTYTSLADFDGDGRVDILCHSGDELWVYRNTSTPGKIVHPRGQLENKGWVTVSQIMVTDFDGDGRADVFGRVSNGDELLVWRSTSNEYRASVASYQSFLSGWNTFSRFLTVGPVP